MVNIDILWDKFWGIYKEPYIEPKIAYYRHNELFSNDKHYNNDFLATLILKPILFNTLTYKNKVKVLKSKNKLFTFSDKLKVVSNVVNNNTETLLMDLLIKEL